MKRARPDIETTVAFLCTRVTKINEDDWKELHRLISFLKSKIDDVRFIEATNLTDIYTWIDAAYTAHNNMISQTGGAISMGHGLIYAKAGIQKLNTKSSTEAEVVGVSDSFPYNIWLINFMDVQGHKIVNNVLYQDNQSEIKMEMN